MRNKTDCLTKEMLKKAWNFLKNQKEPEGMYFFSGRKVWYQPNNGDRVLLTANNMIGKPYHNRQFDVPIEKVWPI